jgi:hypothetical protein
MVMGVGGGEEGVWISCHGLATRARGAERALDVAVCVDDGDWASTLQHDGDDGDQTRRMVNSTWPLRVYLFAMRCHPGGQVGWT